MSLYLDNYGLLFLSRMIKFEAGIDLLIKIILDNCLKSFSDMLLFLKNF